jgi:hypothetical protein
MRVRKPGLPFSQSQEPSPRHGPWRRRTVTPHVSQVNLAWCLPLNSRSPGTPGGRQAQEGGRSSQPRKPRDTALRRPTPPAAAQPTSAREAALLASRFCRQATRCCRSCTLCFLVDQRRNHDDPGEHHEYLHEEPRRHTRRIHAPATRMPPTVTVAIVKTPHDGLPHRAQNLRHVSLVHLLPPRCERHGARQHSE